MLWLHPSPPPSPQKKCFLIFEQPLTSYVYQQLTRNVNIFKKSCSSCDIFWCINTSTTPWISCLIYIVEKSVSLSFATLQKLWPCTRFHKINHWIDQFPNYVPNNLLIYYRPDIAMAVLQTALLLEEIVCLKGCHFLRLQLFDRPGVAGAVLQTALSLTESVSQSVSLFLQIFTTS